MSHIFISYSKKNRDYARLLANHLLDQGFDVWIDDRIDYGVDWWDAIDQAIQNCGAVIVIMTPEARASRWVQREVSLAEDRGKPVFPVLLAGENWSIFVRTQYVDVSGGQLPPAEYVEDLARHSPRHKQRGQEVVPRPAPAAPASSAARRRLFWFGGAALMFVLALALAVAQVVQLQNEDQNLRATQTAAASPEAQPDAPAETLYLQPLERVRIRQRPVDGAEISQVDATDRLEAIEAAAARAKIGVAGEWIEVRLDSGLTGYIAAEYVQEYRPPVTYTGPITGVNLDLYNPLGHPETARLGHIGWARLVYNVSYDPDENTYGNVDLEAAYRRYQPYLQDLAETGCRAILVLNHQTYGEGQGFLFSNLDEAGWQAFIPQFAEYAGVIARQYGGKGLVPVYQIWNEQDAPSETPWSIGMPPETYAALLSAVIPQIRAADPEAVIISGGHIGGAQAGVAYARSALKALTGGARLDGIAFHPYGAGVAQLDENGFVVFGAVDDLVDGYSPLIPGAPVWMTEWGVLDRPDSEPEDVARYAVDLIARMGTRYPGKVAAAVWYAWADGMANGYGLVDPDDRPKQPLFDLFLGT